ncbi:thioredoxin family protein [Mesorhizobium sp. LHD-90]|uniref:DUF1223 domain-containing protein n=1 Tax=Mesorhizobium sp. LHD-90 TaxID=3071414 RepID=UPI0027DF46AF|nr:thioredoxin family protein [Mesorhizobium sp. LHD-90]MDQ6437049.1 thioredoxin family protein [Mesorhizobium sp. LHD-90]
MKREKLTKLAAFALVVMGFALVGGTALAESRKPLGVVELFTSQGCNSCPPADAFFTELVRKGEVVALAYHVDYWDYLGWRDTLAKPENTQRQRDYGRAFGIRSVYTPQAVINGRVHVNGAKKAAVKGTLETLGNSGKGMLVDIKAKQQGESIVIQTGSGPARSKAHLVLVYFDGANPVSIERGENNGSTITYWNAVTEVQTAGMWHGEAARFELPASEIAKKGGAAALLQEVTKDGLPGAILGATVIRNPEPPSTK